METNPNRIFVKPADKENPGINIETEKPYVADGEFVVRNKYVARRLVDGSLVEADAPKSNKKPK